MTSCTFRFDKFALCSFVHAVSIILRVSSKTKMLRHCMQRLRPANLFRGLCTSQTQNFVFPHKPQSIRYSKTHKSLTVSFDDGRQFVLPAEYLRVFSPSADVASKKVIANRRHVGVMKIEPVGNYAVRLVFDDLHDSGIYSWKHLYELGEHKIANIRSYITALRTAGLSRDPRRSTRSQSTVSPPRAPPPKDPSNV
jgi:DUF971 family protein